MPVTCPTCGTTQPEGAVVCTRCGTTLSTRPEARPITTLSPQEVSTYTRYVLRYTLLPVLLTLLVVCVVWMICSNWIR